MRCRVVRRARRFPGGFRDLVAALLAAVLILLSTAATGCGAGGAQTASPGPSAAAVAPGGHIRVGAPLDAGQFDPVLMSGAGGDSLLIGQVLENLVVLSPEFVLQPMLATRWRSLDLRHWEFTLREGVRFSNGARLTAEDVVYSFDRLRSWELGSPLAPAFAHVEAVLATDRAHVTFVLTEEDAEFPNLLADSRCKILCRSVRNPMRNLVGTGPFVLASYDRGRQAILRRNPTYWAKDANDVRLPYLDGLSLFFSADAATQARALSAGKLDWIGGLSPRQIQIVEGKPGLKVTRTPANDCWALQIRCDRGMGRELAFRQALMSGTDRQGLIARVAPNAAAAGNGTFVGPLYSRDYLGSSVAYDPEKARQLLVEAGYASGVGLELVVPRRGLAPALAAAWKAQLDLIGVAVTVETVSPETFYAAAGDRSWQEADFAVVEWRTRLRPESYFRDTMTTDGRWNHSRWSNADFDALVDQIPRTADASERSRLLKEVQEIAQTETPVLNFMIGESVAGQTELLDGVVLTPSWDAVGSALAFAPGEANFRAAHVVRGESH